MGLTHGLIRMSVIWEMKTKNLHQIFDRDPRLGSQTEDSMREACTARKRSRTTGSKQPRQNEHEKPLKQIRLRIEAQVLFIRKLIEVVSDTPRVFYSGLS